jgi:hypothetical protein
MCGCVCLCLCLRGREARTNERERERERERDGGVLYPLLRTVREDIDTAYTRKSRMYVCMCAFLFERQTERDHANEWVKGRERQGCNISALNSVAILGIMALWRERERERESVCACVRARAHVTTTYVNAPILSTYSERKIHSHSRSHWNSHTHKHTPSFLS